MSKSDDGAECETGGTEGPRDPETEGVDSSVVASEDTDGTESNGDSPVVMVSATELEQESDPNMSIWGIKGEHRIWEEGGG